MKKLFYLIVFIGIVITGLFVGSPYYRLYQLQQAYEQKDVATLSQSIDYPKLQANINTQLISRLDSTINKYPLLATIGGNAIKTSGSLLIKKTVENTIHANNVEAILSGQNKYHKATTELAAIWALVSGKVAIDQLLTDAVVHKGDIDIILKNQLQRIQSDAKSLNIKTKENSKNKPELNYCGINCFEVTTKIKGYPITAQLQRQAFINWKIVAIKLP